MSELGDSQTHMAMAHNILPDPNRFDYLSPHEPLPRPEGGKWRASPTCTCTPQSRDCPAHTPGPRRDRQCEYDEQIMREVQQHDYRIQPTIHQRIQMRLDQVYYTQTGRVPPRMTKTGGRAR